MVGYVKGNFFIRYRRFESLAHLNQQLEVWLREDADQRVHGELKEVVAERFERERPHLHPLPAVRYDTSYHESRKVSWDGYLDVRGNRYSVPGSLCGATVSVKIGLDGHLRVFHQEQLVASHQLRPASQGWVSVPEHHAELWQSTLRVQQRPLSVYEEVS
jgi:hypothetical protein